MIADIKRQLSSTFNDAKKNNYPESGKKDQQLQRMFGTNVGRFVYYLREELAEKVAELHRVYDKHSFESPLNFIMVKSDFKRFYESFTQARLSLLYSLELHKDAMFSLKEGKRTLELSARMYKNFGAQISEMTEILDEYHHLVEHDNFDCRGHFAGTEVVWKCAFKKYGFSLVSLLALTAYGVYSARKTLAEVTKSNLD